MVAHSQESSVLVITVVQSSMRRSFPAVPSSPSLLLSSIVQCSRQLLSSIIAECHDSPRDASSTNNLGSYRYPQLSIVIYSNVQSCDTSETRDQSLQHIFFHCVLFQMLHKTENRKLLPCC